jgi:hypothetical protein
MTLRCGVGVAGLPFNAEVAEVPESAEVALRGLWACRVARFERGIGCRGRWIFWNRYDVVGCPRWYWCVVDCGESRAAKVRFVCSCARRNTFKGNIMQCIARIGCRFGM